MIGLKGAQLSFLLGKILETQQVTKLGVTNDYDRGDKQKEPRFPGHARFRSVLGWFDFGSHGLAFG